jgi:hypothetical protein
MESEDVYSYCFWKKGKTTHAWKILQWKVNIWNEMWTCEWKVSDSIGKGVNKTEWKVTDEIVKWSDTSANMFKTAANYTNSAYIRNKFTKKLKK